MNQINGIAFRILGIGSLFACTACTVTLPFSNRLNYNSVTEARKFDAHSKGPISLIWVPKEFPDRIDVQGASGFVGGGSRTRVPTGVALSQRISEAIDASVGVKDGAKRKLTITVETAQSTFEYSAGIFNITPAIDDAGCVFTASFDLDGKTWKQTFTSKLHDPKVGGSSQTALLEKAWDDIAIQVAKNVSAHLNQLDT
jgi:hypothetical protein